MLDEPNLNCEHCYMLKAKARTKPACEKPVGCHIEDLASDLDINEACRKFTLAKNLFQVSKLPESQHRIFEELELFEDEEAWAEMEIIYAEWLNKQREKSTKSEGTKWKRK